MSDYLQLILKLKSKNPPMQLQVGSQVCKQPTGEVLRLDTSPGWRSPIIFYLKEGSLPDDRVEVWKLQHLATRYVLFGDILYKKSYSNLHPDPYMRRLGPEGAQKVMQEIHD